MNTIEPDYLLEKRSLCAELRDYEGTPFEEDKNNSELLQKLERERSEWFISVLERDAISNEEEDRQKFFSLLDLCGYTYIGKIRLGRKLFKVLYRLKLVKV